ncbi:hypothetical protein A0H76_1480 [Hepatospora eriocheir]|uniref:Uncharacterized protein n=1 Tax=Hepatospora eriocheir TaxID=1081669 RepID=A0A1X0Q5Z7_9MICR|nr:hypothetical protein A0H76_1480 [Hepatospora eriocheir]
MSICNFFKDLLKYIISTINFYNCYLKAKSELEILMDFWKIILPLQLINKMSRNNNLNMSFNESEETLKHMDEEQSNNNNCCKLKRNNSGMRCFNVNFIFLLT